MKRLLCITLALVLSSLCVHADPGFHNGGFEKNLKAGRPPGWGVKIAMASGQPGTADFTLDRNVKHEAKQSLRIEKTPLHDNIILETKLGDVVSGKTYELSFYAKMEGSVSLSVRENHIRPNGKWRSELFRSPISVRGPIAWRKLSTTIIAHEGDAKLGISIFLDSGQGTVWLDDFSIQEVTTIKGQEVVFRMTPNFYLSDNVFRLPQGAPLPMFLTCSNQEMHKAVNPRTVIELPASIDLLSCGYDSREFKKPEALVQNGIDYLRHEHTMGLPKSVMRSPDFVRTAFDSVVPLLSTSAAAGETEFPCSIYYRDDEITCDPSEFRIRIMPPLPKVVAPKTFSTGIHAGTGFDFYGEPIKRLMKFYADSGFNDIYLPDILRAGSLTPKVTMRDPKPVFDAAHAEGIRTYSCESKMVNAYTLRYTRAGREAPEETRLKQASGKIVHDAFDPAYMRRKGDWYVRAVHEVVDAAIKLETAGIWINWEPHQFIGDHGSFTEQSLRDFAIFADLDEAEVLQAEPEVLFAQHQEAWQRFQSEQCGQAMRAMMEIIEARCKEQSHPLEIIICTGNLFFRPSESNEQLGKGATKQERRRQVYRRSFDTSCWLPAFPTVSSWFYRFFNSDDYLDPDLRQLIDAGYRYHESARKSVEPRSHLETLTRVETMMGYLREQEQQLGIDRRRYVHLTQNLQVNNWVVKPRAIGMQMMAAFLGGADGVDLYYFPAGYDGSYWRSAVETNGQIARFESFVREGRRIHKGIEAQCLSDMRKSKRGDESHRLAVRAFQKEGRTLIAIANFDPAMAIPAEVKLSVNPGRYRVTAPGTGKEIRSRKQDWLTADELASFTLEIPALSTRILVLERWTQGEDASDLTPLYLDELHNRMLQRLPELNRQYHQRELRADAASRRYYGAGSVLLDQP